jgi:thioesterase domain-containing protein
MGLFTGSSTRRDDPSMGAGLGNGYDAPVQCASGDREEGCVRLGPEGGAEPLFFVYPGLDAPFCHELAAARPGRPFILLPRREVSAHEPVPDFAEFARRHVETIRGVRPSGPYAVGGFAAGAPLALEIACQLEGAGEKVAELLLVADPELCARWWRAARAAAGLLSGRDPVERLDLFNFTGRLGQLAIDSFKSGGLARLRESFARARHRVHRQGALQAFGPNSRSSDDTLKALLWAWAGHRARTPRARAARVAVERNENGAPELDRTRASYWTQPMDGS